MPGGIRIAWFSRVPRHLLASGVEIALISICAGWARADSPPVLEHPGWTMTAAFGAMGAVGSPRFKITPDYPPVGFGVGASLLMERGWYGAEVSAKVTEGGCSGGEGPSPCGALWIFDIGPRATLFPWSAWSPYATLHLQLLYGSHSTFSYTSDESGEVVPASGLRLGVRYRGDRAGFYLEAGPSWGFTQDCSGLGCQTLWLVQFSTGVSFSWLL